MERRALLAAGGGLAAGIFGLPQVASGNPTPGEQGWVTSTLRRMTLEEKVGQLFCTYVYGPAPDTVDARNRSAYGVDTPAQVVDKYALGGVIYFGWSANLADPVQVANLSNGIQRASLGRRSRVQVPLIVSIDQEHGAIQRLGPPAAQFPGAMALGAGRSPGNAYQAAVIAGRELKAVGVNNDYSPLADVNVNPRNPVIGVRSFASDPALVSGLTAAQVVGFQRGAGVISAVKHFPGHGDTETDSHTGLPEIPHTREEWESIDAPPFRAAIAAGLDMVMTAHIVVESLDPALDPATLSRPIMTGVLRGELGFDGVVVTDSLGMAGVRSRYGDDRVPVLALLAGVDMLLMPPRFDVARDGVFAAVASGELTEERIDESVRRILSLKWRRGLVAAPLVDVGKVGDVVGIPAHLAAAQDFSDRAVTVVRNDAGLLPMSRAARSVLVTGVDVSGRNPVGTLAQRLVARGATAEALPLSVLPTMPTDAAIAGAVAAAGRHDLTVVLTTKAWDVKETDKNAKQQQLVHQLVAAGRPVVVVAIRDPYDIAYFPEVTTYLVAYAFTAELMEAVARVLHGEVTPRGRLPVTIPTADDPEVALHPYGHGLTW